MQVVFIVSLTDTGDIDSVWQREADAWRRVDELAPPHNVTVTSRVLDSTVQL